MTTAPVPDWMRSATPGDGRLLGQDCYWIQADGAIRPLAEMTSDHLANVVSYLRANAVQLHTVAMIDALLDLVAANAAGTTTADAITHALTGQSIATLDADSFVQTSPLVRAIRRELTGRGARER